DGVAGVADEPQHLPASDPVVVPRESAVAGEVRVVVLVAGRVDEPEPPASDTVPADREDRAVRDRDHGCPERGEEVVAVMPAATNVAAVRPVGVAPGDVPDDGEGVCGRAE